jgi:hypothetical protein
MSNKKQLLDPISTMCKIVALNFMEVNTKLSISDHILNLHEPNKYQSLIRLYNGDSKENIGDLYFVIIRLIKWYLIKDVENSLNNYNLISHSDELTKMIKYLCYSFIKLQETYKFGNVVMALQFYINLLNDGLNDYFNEDNLPPLEEMTSLDESIKLLKQKQDKRNDILYSRLPMNLSKKDDEFENLLDYEKIKNFWTVDKLKRICDLYDNCFKVQYDNEMTKEIKIGLIESYLKSIFAILNIIDKEFQTLISNCDKG